MTIPVAEKKVRHKNGHNLTSHIFHRDKHSSADPVLTQHRKPHPACHDMPLHKKWIARPRGCWQPAHLAATLEQSEEYRLLPVFFQPSPGQPPVSTLQSFPPLLVMGKEYVAVLSLLNASWHHTAIRASSGSRLSSQSYMKSQANLLLFFSLLLKKWKAL